MKAEDRFVQRLQAMLPRSERVLIGPGDDAAVIAAISHPLVATTDLCVENIDFLPDQPAEGIGRRALAVNLSDLAAMGARPEFFLLSIGFRRELGDEYPLAIARGALSLAELFGARLVGGDLSAACETVVSIALWGSAEHGPLTRSGARPGDLLFLSGSTGRAAAGLSLARHRPAGLEEAAPSPPPLGLRHEEQQELLDAYQDPQPRVELGLFLARNGIGHAAIDISDGLGVDAARLARSSSVRTVLEADRIPISSALASFSRAEGVDVFDRVLAGGDDYELLFASPPEAAALLEQAHPEWGTSVKLIGRIEEGSGAVLRGEGDRDISEMGHDHLDEQTRAHR